MKRLLSYPLFVGWDLTYRCNINCKHCFFGSFYSDERKELSTDQIKKTIKELSENNIISLQLAGGEPLLRNNTIEIIEFSRSLGIVTTLATNGLFIDKKMAKNLKKSGVSSIQISLDGFLKHHELIRGKNTYIRTVEGVKNVISENIPVSVAILINKFNYLKISEIITFLAEIGVDAVRLQFLLLEGRARKNSNFLYIDKNLLKETVTNALENEYIKSKKISLILPCYYPKSNEDLIENNDFSRSSFLSNSCGAGTTSLNIDPYGNVTACGILTGEKWFVGNITTENLKDIWNSKKFDIWRNIVKPEGCKNCSLFSSCLGGCRANSWFMHDSFFEKDPYCWR